MDKESPRFIRGGLAATFALDLLDFRGRGVVFDCDVEHKNPDGTALTLAGSFATMYAIDVYRFDVSGSKEAVRRVFRVGGTSPTNGAYLHVPAPSWRPY